MLPEKCTMPDLSDLSRLFPLLLTSVLMGDPDLTWKGGLHRKNFLRLVDKAIYEYEKAREVLIALVKNEKRNKEEFHQEHKATLFLSDFPLVDHLENCLNAIVRLHKIIDRIKRGPDSEKIPKLARRIVQKSKKQFQDIRNVIEHMDELIHFDNIECLKPIMLDLSDQGKAISIATYELNFRDLAFNIRALHKLGKELSKLGKPKDIG